MYQLALLDAIRRLARPLLAAVLVCSSVALSTPGYAGAAYDTRLSATMSVVSLSTSPLSFVTVVFDDGSNPTTTFGLVDPSGAFGSFASATGTLTPSSTPGQLTGGVSTNGVAIGLPGIPLALATSQALVEGGFVLVNANSNPAELDLFVDWSWATSVAAGAGALDIAIGSMTLELLVDDTVLERIAEPFTVAPPSGSAAETGTSSFRIVLNAFSEAQYSLRLTSLGIAQDGATVPLSQVPTAALVGLAMLLSAAAGRVSSAGSFRASDRGRLSQIPAQPGNRSDLCGAVSIASHFAVLQPPAVA